MEVRRITSIHLIIHKGPLNSTKDQNATVPLSKLANWTKEEVQAWFLSSDFKEFASRFPLSGMYLAGFTEAQFQKELGNVQGSALYNTMQALKGEKGTLAFICFKIITF